MGCHVAVGKFPMTTREWNFEKKKFGMTLPNPATNQK
jgi:hypothetical protein